jgi:hypothetical protein
MNEKYLEDLYGWIKGKDASYESRYNYDTFKQKMQDPEYAKSMHGWIATKDPSFSERRPLDTFIQQVKVNGVSQPAKAVPSKKKFASESPSEDSSLASQQSKKVFAADKRVSNSLNSINQDLMNDTEENVVAKLSKDQNFKELGFSFEESGATGDYMTVTAPNGQTKEISLDNFLNSKSAAQSVELKNFINKNTTKERRANLEQVAYIEDTNAKIAQYDKKKFGQQFAQEGSKPIDKKNSKYLNDRLKTIDAKLINQNEEYVVPQMNYQFGDLGFKFEESGATGDYMVATAPNGKKMEISLDPFMSSKAVSESAKLQQFIKDNTPDKGLYVIEKAANEENKKYTTQKDVDASIKKVADDANNLNLSLKSFLAKKDKFDKLDKNNPEYMRIQSELILERESLMSKQEQIKTKEVLLKKSVGKYTEMKGQQGTWLEGTWNAINDASASITAGFTDMAIDVLAEVSPNEMQMSPKDLKEKSIGFSKKLGIKPPSEKQTYAQWKATLTEDQQDAVEDELDDITKKSMKKDVIPAIRKGNREVYGFSSTTPEWEQLQSEGFWGGAYFGLVKTAPALIGGAGPAGWAQRTAQMYSMVSDGLRQEMDKNPEFEKVSENEKLAVILPIGITGAVLEEFGLKNIKGSTGLINKIAMSALGKAGTATTAKSFRELVENEVESKLAKGLLTLTSAGLAEAESGAAQEATETGIKEIYNVIKGKEMFKTPDSIGELIGNVVKAGAQEAVGGFVLGMPTAVSAAYSQKGFLKMDDQNFRIFEATANDENIQKAFITNLKTKITQGVMTTAEAKEELNNYRNSIGLFKSLPEGLNTQQKKEAMNLLKEKRDLQNQVDGKDPSLVVKLKERIGAIDVSLVGISETAANDKAVAESNRQEFDDLPEAQKEKLKKEAGKKIMDMIGDRNDQDVELDEDTVNEVAFRDFVKQKEAVNRISEIETALSPDAETQVTGREKRKLEKELSKLKETQDAIQEQTTDEGLLRSQQSEMGLQGVGEGNTQPQAASSTETITNAKPQEQIDIDLTLPENKDNIIVSDSSNGFILIDSDTNQPIEVFNDNAGENSGISKPYATQEEAQARIEELKVQPENIIEEQPTDYKAISETVLDKNQLNTVRASLRASSPDSFSLEILDAIAKGQSIDTGNDLLNEQIDDATENGVSINTIANLILEDDFLIESKGIDSKRKAIDYALNIGAKGTILKAGQQAVSSKTQQTTQTQTNETTTTTNEVQPERTGNGGTTRAAIGKTTPLEGAPKTNGATGPDEQLVSVAEKYAAENGIDLKRQGEYVEVDEERAKRIADAYEEMENNPQDPRVKKAYAEMIKQTKAQYQALVDAGYKFWFIDLNNPDDIDYISSPYNAMRDLRQNKQMGVFPTEAGFGSDEDVDVSKNPLLEDTGIMWASGGLDGEMMPVTANDLFRAVHDAFGHGLEGSGFRARGEENAWQAHSRLYTGDAVGAMTSETRGQNSWVNFGPNGERNRTASAEDTKFADQKVGLMPEWTWTEGRASDMAAEGEVAENLAEENAPEELGTQGLSEAELKGYDRMMDIVNGITEKVLKERGGTKERAFKAALDYLQQDSKVYEIASDVQREALVRKLRKQFGIREKSAPSVGRLFGTVKNVAKITMTEKAALVKQIKDLGRGAKDAVKAWKIASQELSKQIKELKASGKITSDQAANVIRAFSKVNVFSQKSVDRFTQYMTKVFEKADYANKLNKAKEVRAQIKKLSRNKDKNANLRDLASKFSKIDPSIVVDIDKYNALAAQIKSATDGSKIRGQKIKWSEVVNIADATDYVNQEMEAQDKILKEEKAAELEELLGEDAATIDSLLELDPDQDIPEEDVETVREAIKRVFDTYAESIKSSVVSGVDSFTGEDVSFTKKETETIGKFIAMDIDKMTDKNALQAVDALANFIENRSTAKMAATIATYTGNNNADVVADKGIYAVPLKKLFSPKFGAFLGEQTTTLPMLFEKMFKGFNRGGTVMDAMGLTKLINRKAFAETQANNIVADYIKEFYNSKSKPNGQAFNTAYNNIERGMAAFMLRNVIGTEVEMQAEFDRRKGLVKESIDVLAEGNKLQKKKAELYQKAYDKMVVDSENIQDIKDKTDPKNLEAVDFWHKQWESKFDQMADVASGIYNKILDKDLNYSPDKFTKLKVGKKVDLLNSESAFIGNTNGVLYKNKSGVLEDVTRPSKLPSENKKTTSYIDLSFDKNNSNSMYDALVDIETAEPIRQVQAFLDSDGYSRVVPDSDNADMLAKRIDTYVQNIRSKNPFSNDEFSKTMKSLNKMAILGVGQALGGVTQPIKQVVPVVLNTLINGQGVALGASYDKDFMSWLNGSGYAIANRGIQSQGAIDSLNKMLDEAADSKGKKMLELIEKANALMLRTFLERPDVFIATASWKTYYEKSLKKQGIDTSDIDYSDHDVNEDAANYAQRMVDRQQNISDQDLAGNLFTDKNAKSQVLRNIFMPFASFRMNQASRFAADLSVLGHWSVSTAEDKKIALLSLSSFATEMAVFKLLSAGIGVALSSAAVAWVGKDESDEEEEKRKNNIYKGQATSAITDIFSPLPVLDKMVQTGAATFLSGIQEGLDVTEEDKLALFNSKPQDYLKNLGLYGMAADRLVELSKLIDLSVTGEYTDDYGETKTISDESKDALSAMIGPALLTNIGLGPSELAGIIRNSVKISKKKGKKISKEEIKKSNPKLYERIYGKNTSEGRIKEREDKMDDRVESRLKQREGLR